MVVIRDIKYTDDELLDALKRFKKKYGRPPKFRDLFNRKTYPAPVTFVRRFGTWNEALKAAEMKVYRKIKNEKELSQILQTYKKDLEEDKTKATIKGKISVLSDIDLFLKDKGKEWKDLDYKLTKDYFTHLKEKGAYMTYARYMTKKNSPQTLMIKYRVLSAFLTWLLCYAKQRNEEPIIPESEIAKIKYRIKSPKIICREKRASKRRALSQNDVAMIREAIQSPIIMSLFGIGLNLGLRSIEYERLKVENYHPEYKYIDVDGKGHKLRDVVLTEAMIELINYQLELRKQNNVDHEFLFFQTRTKNRLLRSEVHRIYHELSAQTGIKFNAHELRYTMDAMMMKKGVPPNIIAQRLGHGGSLTFHYARETINVRVRILEEKVSIL